MSYVQRPTFWARRSDPISDPTRQLIEHFLAGHSVSPQAINERQEELFSAFRASVGGTNWLKMIAYIAIEVGSHAPGETTDFADRYGVEARVEYLLAVCLGSPADAEVNVQPAQVKAAMSFVNEVFELEGLSTELAFSGSDYLSLLGRRLRMERLNDRFEHFARHGRLMRSATVDKMKVDFETEFGWTLDDYWSVADAAAHLSNDKRDEVRRLIRQDDGLIDEWFPDPESTELRMIEITSSYALHGVEELARRANIPTERVQRVLDYLTRPVSEPIPAFSPSKADPLRVRNVVRHGELYLIPLPHMWSQNSFRLVDLLLSDSTVLKLKWLRVRDSGTEELVAARLARIFGFHRVLSSAKHIGGLEDGETDVIVQLGDDAIVVECKAHTLTDAGRRGLPLRLDSRTDDILTKAFEQVEKARTHIRANGSFRISPGGDFTIVPGAGALLPGLVVSFERIDPMFMNTALRAFDTEAVLAIGLPDFLSLTDVVSEPSLLVKYIVERTKILGMTNVSAATELDFVAMFMEFQDLSNLLEYGGDSEADVWIERYAQELNPILAVSEEVFQSPKPGYPPQSVLSALRRLLDMPVIGWTAVALSIHAVRPTDWRSFKQMLRKASRARRAKPPRNRRWVSSSGTVAISLVAEAQPESISHGALDELAMHPIR